MHGREVDIPPCDRYQFPITPKGVCLVPSGYVPDTIELETAVYVKTSAVVKSNAYPFTARVWVYEANRLV